MKTPLESNNICYAHLHYKQSSLWSLYYLWLCLCTPIFPTGMQSQSVFDHGV
jgi:hypothetical protein